MNTVLLLWPMIARQHRRFSMYLQENGVKMVAVSVLGDESAYSLKGQASSVSLHVPLSDKPS